MSWLTAAACVALGLFAVAVMVTVAFFTQPGPPATGTTTTVPALAPSASEATRPVAGADSGGAGLARPSTPSDRSGTRPPTP